MRRPIRTAMAKPREARGWFAYGVAVSVVFLMLGFRLHYGLGSPVSPSLLLPWIDVPFAIGVLAGVLAALGLHQALWYSLVKPGGWATYAASLLMFAVATLFFYALPDHLATRGSFYLLFTVGLVQFAYVPTLSYGSKVYLGIAIAGEGLFLASLLLGPTLPLGVPGTGHLLRPVVLATVVAQGLLLLALFRLLLFTLEAPRASSA